MPLRPLALALLVSLPALAQNAPSATATPAAPVTVASSPEVMWSKADEALVTLEGPEATGLGFLVQIKGTVCLITSQDTLLKTRGQTLKTKAGKALPPAKFFLSDNGALALGRFDKAPAGVVFLESATDLSTIAPKQKLLTARADMALLSPEVASVKNDVIDLVVPQAAKPWPEGHPVLDPSDGKAVGIYTPVVSRELTQNGSTVEGADRGEISKEGVQARLSRWDKVAKWLEFAPGRARDEGLRVQRFHDHTRQVAAFLELGANYKEVCDVTRAFQKYTDDISKPRLQPDYVATQHSQFTGYFPVLAKRDTDVLQRDSVYFYPWYRQQVVEMVRVRSEVVAKATEMIKASSGPFSKPSAR